MTPNQVDKDNQHKVWNTLYGKHEKDRKPTLKVGDVVRISKTRRTFKKGYLPNWSEELFTIATVKRTIPVTYLIREENGDLVKGGFYEQELQKTQKKRIFEIDYELDKRVLKGRPQTLVKWKGYPVSYNKWIYDRDLKKFKKEAVRSTNK